MANYLIASDEGAQRYGGEVGATVSLDLEEGEERAVVCAGWLTPNEKPAKPTESKE